MTIAEQIQEQMQRREALKIELEQIEHDLINAGAILSVTVESAQFLRRRGRTLQGNSCRAKILALLSDGHDWHSRDIVSRIPLKPESILAQISRMSTEGDIARVSWGVYRVQRPSNGQSA